MDQLINLFVTLIKLPSLAIIKTIITILNLIPLPIYEVHGIRGTSSENRPDLREIHSLIKGKRKIHLGSFLIAWSRGAVFKAHLNTSGKTCWGIYPEDYQNIQSKWLW